MEPMFFYLMGLLILLSWTNKLSRAVLNKRYVNAIAFGIIFLISLATFVAVVGPTAAMLQEMITTLVAVKFGLLLLMAILVYPRKPKLGFVIMMLSMGMFAVLVVLNYNPTLILGEPAPGLPTESHFIYPPATFSIALGAIMLALLKWIEGPWRKKGLWYVTGIALVLVTVFFVTIFS